MRADTVRGAHSNGRQNVQSQAHEQALAKEGARLYLKIDDRTAVFLPRVEALLRIFSGQTAVVIYDARNGRKMLSSSGADTKPLLVSELARLLGESSVVIK